MKCVITIYIMAYRQVKRFLRAKSHVIGSIVNPIVWLVLFGLGWSRVLSFPMAKEIFQGLDYMSYLAPGIVMMTIFTSSFIGGATVIWDKEFGFLKEVLVAPVSRTASIVGRALGDTLVALVQGIVVLAVTMLMIGTLDPLGVPIAIASGALVALSFTSIGIAIASKMRSIEGFHLITSLIMLPLIFLSGAIYPINSMPMWMKALAYINPLTYGVDLARWALTGVSQINPTISAIVLVALTAIMIALASQIFSRATIE